ncbi:hypothetical protein HN51_056406 [Arachis hypogaea]|uniref:Zinc finger CCCH domain-containing protein n=2 Tax=Arachis hypogaea TaxID=3818 RepID=A0A444XUN6_ARAHY|nr:zinc finger CCCH domain-containing protein 44 [Arachis ipaensis]XP_025680055.1 zinc finger CCCH domain-containing protein 44 [Arachis hypogaea]QHN79253.1 Zinc finger CCCH domain-containing protein [Arachis hypogaea]RYQ93164.1 hypothetical protein Ahy_B09g099446 [Arachis hypogaea]
MDRKRGRHEHPFNGTGNGASKKFRPPSASEMESFPTGLGSKLKPCTKFFSTSGCPFGEGCHFLHYVPGGIKTVQMMNAGSNPALPQVSRTPPVPPSFPDGSSPPMVKTRLCNKYNSSEGCKFGDKCHFAHGEWEIGKPTMPSYEDRQRIGGRVETPAHGAAAGFGASATAKISINASLAGAVIGKNGINSKQICRVTGAKLSIREHDSDPNLKNIELEGSFDQIKQASSMVHELILNVSSAAGPAKKNVTSYGPGSNNFKTKICEKFSKGSCTFGEKCHFAHGIEELRKSGM